LGAAELAPVPARAARTPLSATTLTPPLHTCQALLALTPESALLCELDEDGGVAATTEVATAMVHKGDVLKVGRCWRGGWRGAEGFRGAE
jgi:hypothetical protein